VKTKLIQAAYLIAAFVAMTGWAWLIFECGEWVLGF
jgi:hypothetical protein